MGMTWAVFNQSVVQVDSVVCIGFIADQPFRNYCKGLEIKSDSVGYN